MLKGKTTSGKDEIVSDSSGNPLVITSDATSISGTSSSFASLPANTQVLDGTTIIGVKAPVFANNLPLTVRDQFNIKM